MRQSRKFEAVLTQVPTVEFLALSNMWSLDTNLISELGARRRNTHALPTHIKVTRQSPPPPPQSHVTREDLIVEGC